MINKITIGADIEVFLVDHTGKFISAIDKIGGSKKHPKKLTEKGHAVQEDNVAAEFNIPAATTPERFATEIMISLDGLKKIIDGKYLINIQSSALFEPDQLQDARAREFGCDPDWNAYTLEENPKPNIFKNPTLRTIGGHIHIGYENPDMLFNREIIFAMDLMLGIPSLILDRDVQRRQLYGKAGAFRVKPYGVEYRTLSSFWIKNIEMMKWAFKNTMKAIDLINNGKYINEDDKVVIQKCINEGDKPTAELLMSIYSIPMPNHALVKQTDFICVE